MSSLFSFSHFIDDILIRHFLLENDHKYTNYLHLITGATEMKNTTLLTDHILQVELFPLLIPMLAHFLQWLLDLQEEYIIVTWTSSRRLHLSLEKCPVQGHFHWSIWQIYTDSRLFRHVVEASQASTPRN